MVNKTDNGDQPALTDLITLKDASRLCGLSHDHLRRLAGKGDIWAMKVGRDWATTKMAIEEYMASDRRPGPKSN